MPSKNVKLMQGNEACVEGALAAGMKFFAGYPITPSTEIAEISAQRLPRVGGKFIQMEDEIAGMAATIGGSLAGLKSMTATSGPGFSLKQENIGYAMLTEIPCVIVDVQRGGPSTGLPTAPSQSDVMQAKWGTHGDHPVIALTPSSIRETYDLTIQAFNFAEKYRTPVFLMLDEIIGHMREKIEIPDPSEIEIFDRVTPDESEKESYKAYDNNLEVPKMAAFGEGFRFHVTGLMHDEFGFPKNDTTVTEVLMSRIMGKIENNLDDIILYDEYYTEDMDLLILSYGGTVRSVLSAAREAQRAGKKVGVFKVKTLWPFPEKRITELSKTVNKILVAEMNLGQYFYEVDRVAGKNCEVSLLGKANGEPITPTEVRNKIEEVL
jgi:2-oxoglutarate/2-oxoacid ferredoxin oxidoreductase subunit alpha